MQVEHFLRLAIGIVAAVGKAHQRGLVHKDIKPANILVNGATGARESSARPQRRTGSRSVPILPSSRRRSRSPMARQSSSDRSVQRTSRSSSPW